MDRLAERWKGQEEVILNHYKANATEYLTAEDVHNTGLFHDNTPLTSIRRGITNLMKAGVLEKTSKKKLGKFGEYIHCYILRMNQYEQFHPMLGPSWGEALGPTMESEYMGNLYRGLSEKQVTSMIHPANPDHVFRAFRMTPLDEVKVVILGQDPYNAYDTDPDVADGLAFSSGNESVQPPSLRQILIAVEKSYGPVDIQLRAERTLEGWAAQGVLLLNQALTCMHNKAGSHMEDWKPFLHAVLDELINVPYLVWMLWGTEARAYGKGIVTKSAGVHTVITAEHPVASVYSGVEEWNYEDCFNRCNASLKNIEDTPIDWKLTDIMPF